MSYWEVVSRDHLYCLIYAICLPNEQLKQKEIYLCWTARYQSNKRLKEYPYAVANHGG
jgi:L-rhamnose isomerase